MVGDERMTDKDAFPSVYSPCSSRPVITLMDRMKRMNNLRHKAFLS